MKVLILSGSPNRDGLTAACAEAALRGCSRAGAEAEHLFLKDRAIGLCRACGNGWGSCRENHICQVSDDFQDLHAKMNGTDALILVSPVYWGELSEIAKAFTDRYRRCENRHLGGSGLYEKPFIGVAAAGGSGGGTVSCIAQMERFVQHLGAVRHELIPVTRRTREESLAHIERSTARMAGGGN